MSKRPSGIFYDQRRQQVTFPPRCSHLCALRWLRLVIHIAEGAFVTECDSSNLFSSRNTFIFSLLDILHPSPAEKDTYETPHIHIHTCTWVRAHPHTHTNTHMHTNKYPNLPRSFTDCKTWQQVQQAERDKQIDRLSCAYLLGFSQEMKSNWVFVDSGKWVFQNLYWEKQFWPSEVMWYPYSIHRKLRS